MLLIRFILVFYFILTLSCQDKINQNITIIKYYNSGEVYSIEECTIDSIQDGKAKYFYRSGALESKVAFVNGKMEGEGIIYYNTGEIKTKLNFVHGNIDGELIDYFKNGKISVLAHYKNKIEYGSTYVYRKDGSLNSYLFYDRNDGELIYRKSYNSDGTLKEEVGDIFGTVEINRTIFTVGEEMWIEILPVNPPNSRSKMRLTIYEDKELKKSVEEVELIQKDNKYDFRRKMNKEGVFYVVMDMELTTDGEEQISVRDYDITVEVR